MCLFVAFQFLLSITNQYPTVLKSHVILTWLDLSDIITKLIPTSSLVLFCATGFLISDLFRRLRYQAISFTYGNDNGRTPNIQQYLRKMQRQHELLIRCVIRLDKTFGPCFLLEVPFVFIGVINSSVNLFFSVSSSSAGKDGWISFLQVIVPNLFICNYIVNLAFMIHVAEKIREQVHVYGAIIFITLFHTDCCTRRR